MSHTYCHTHSKYDCPTCADEILSLGIQADKDRIAALELENKELRANAARFLRLAQRVPEKKPPDLLLTEFRKAKGRNACVEPIPAAELARLRENAAEADELRKDAELGECIREKFRLMKGSTAVRFLGCLGVNEPEGGFDWSKTVLELIDAAIAQDKGE